MWQDLISITEFPLGEGREFTVGDQIVAVFNLAGNLRAIDGICPHAGGPLAEGTVSGEVVTCPWHGWQFQLATGQHCLTPRIRQACYAVRVENGMLQVELP